MMKTIKSCSIIIFVLLFIPAAYSYELHPLSLNLEEVGQNSSGIFRIKNTNRRPLTLEVEATRRIYDSHYYNDTLPADEDFIIMPPQAYIEPGDFQVFRVRYIGAEPLTQSAGYRVVFRQLPVDLDPGEGTNVQMVLHVHAGVYVSPNGVQPEITSEIDYAPLFNETRFPTETFDLDNPSGVIVLRNYGDGVQDLSKGLLELTLDNGEVRHLAWQEFGSAVFIRFLLPQGESRLPIEGLSLGEGHRVTAARFVST